MVLEFPVLELEFFALLSSSPEQIFIHLFVDGSHGLLIIEEFEINFSFQPSNNRINLIFEHFQKIMNPDFYVLRQFKS